MPQFTRTPVRLRSVWQFALVGALLCGGTDSYAARGEAKAKGRATSEEGVDPANLPPEMTRSLEDLLDDPEGVVPDRKETRCVNRRIAVQTEILDAEHLLFRSAVGSKAWLNRLSPGCIGLRPDMVLFIEGRGSSMCEFDMVRGQSRLQGTGIQTGRCALGKFEPITELHAKTLEDTFKVRRKEMAKARSKERVEKRKARRKERAERRAKRKAEKLQKSQKAEEAA